MTDTPVLGQKVQDQEHTVRVNSPIDADAVFQCGRRLRVHAARAALREANATAMQLSPFVIGI